MKYSYNEVNNLKNHGYELNVFSKVGCRGVAYLGGLLKDSPGSVPLRLRLGKFPCFEN